MPDLNLRLRLEGENGQLIATLRASSSEVERFTGEVNQGAAATNRHNRATERAAAANRRAERSFRNARFAAARYFALIGGTYALVQLTRNTLAAADAYTEINNRLRLVSDSERDLAAQRTELFRISQDTRTGLEANAQLYGRLALASEEYGRSEAELLRVTELLNKQVRIGGNNATEAAAGLVQFAQGIASGRLQGDELRSVLESLQGVSAGLIEGFRVLRERGEIDFAVTRGNIRELAAEGILSSQLLLDAVLASGDDTERKFAQVSATVADGSTRIGNALQIYIGQFDEATRVSERLANALGGIADRIEDASRPLIVGPDDVAYTEQLTGSIVQLEQRYLQFLRHLEDPDQDALEAQLAIARQALERFGEELFVGQAGFQARQRAQELIARFTGLTRENIASTLADTRLELDAAIAQLEQDLADRAERRSRNVLSGRGLLAGDPFNRRVEAEARERIAALRAELDELERRASRLVGTIDVGVGRLRAPDPIREIDVGVNRRPELRGTGRARDVVGDAGRELLSARQRDTDAARAAFEDAQRALEEHRIQRIEAIRAHREQEFLEAQGFRDREEAAEDAHQRTLLALRTRYAGGAFQALLQNQHQAQQQLEAGNQRAVAQIVLGQTQATLGALGRYNRRAFRLAQVAGIAKAVIDTQQAITEALKQPPPLNFIFAGLAAAQGAAAVATIRAQRPPQAFQRGGIVDSPVFFQSRDVERGVAGEAGPEAIVPLRRGRDGNLGIAADPGRRVTVNFAPRVAIRVSGDASDPATLERLGREAAGAVEAQMEAVIARQLRPGGLLNRLSVA